MTIFLFYLSALGWHIVSYFLLKTLDASLPRFFLDRPNRKQQFIMHYAIPAVEFMYYATAVLVITLGFCVIYDVLYLQNIKEIK